MFDEKLIDILSIQFWDNGVTIVIGFLINFYVPFECKYVESISCSEIRYPIFITPLSNVYASHCTFDGI